MFYSIFYTNNKYRDRETFVRQQLQDAGFDKVIHYTREWLVSTDFYSDNREILDMAKGNGFWLWKPFIILETMKSIKDDDVVFYMDAGDKITNPCILNEIKEGIADKDYMISGTKHRSSNKKYTKRDCFILMDCDKPEYHSTCQIEAGILVFKKTVAMQDFLNEWLHYCKNKNILTNIPNIHGDNYDGFIDHRGDQSILSLLMIKYEMTYSHSLYSCIFCNYFIP